MITNFIIIQLMRKNLLKMTQEKNPEKGFISLFLNKKQFFA